MRMMLSSDSVCSQVEKLTGPPQSSWRVAQLLSAVKWITARQSSSKGTKSLRLAMRKRVGAADRSRSTSTPRRPAFAAPCKSLISLSPTCRALDAANPWCFKAASKISRSGLAWPTWLEVKIYSKEIAMPRPSRMRRSRESKFEITSRMIPRFLSAARV